MISLNGGRYGLWRKDSGEIYFLAPDNEIMAASVRTQGADLVIGEIRPLFKFQFQRYRLDAFPYAVSPDGQQFLVNTLLEVSAPPSIALLTNWRGLVHKQ